MKTYWWFDEKKAKAENGQSLFTVEYQGQQWVINKVGNRKPPAAVEFVIAVDEFSLEYFKVSNSQKPLKAKYNVFKKEAK